MIIIILNVILFTALFIWVDQCFFTNDEDFDQRQAEIEKFKIPQEQQDWLDSHHN